MTRLSKKEKMHLKYQIYYKRYDNPWITDKKIAKSLKRSISTVNRYARKAEEENVIWNPSIRLKYHPEKKSALVLVDDKNKAFEELQNVPGVEYLCIYQGNWDFMLTYTEPMKLSKIPGYKEAVVKGQRGVVFSPKVPYTSWRECFEPINELLAEQYLQKFSYGEKAQFPQWDEEEWKLYHYFKENLRKSFNEFRKESLISWRKYIAWKKTLEKYCAISTYYFPEGSLSYTSHTFCFRTPYERYIATLFSHLPTSSTFHKIEDYCMINLFLPKDYTIHDKILNIFSRMLEKGIISEYIDGYAVMHWVKE